MASPEAPPPSSVPPSPILVGLFKELGANAITMNVAEVYTSLQTHLIEEHGADPDRAATQSTSTNSLKLLRQARERLGQGLRAVDADNLAGSDGISLRNQ